VHLLLTRDGFTRSQPLQSQPATQIAASGSATRWHAISFYASGVYHQVQGDASADLTTLPDLEVQLWNDS
jgi:hypothetical protein